MHDLAFLYYLAVKTPHSCHVLPGVIIQHIWYANNLGLPKK